MPQFVFSATDRAGNTIEGDIAANDMVQAAEQVRQMGYTPVRVQVTNQTSGSVALPNRAPAPSVPGALQPGTFVPYQAVPAPVAAPSTPAPIDLTQTMAVEPLPGRAPLVPLGGEDSEVTARMQHLEMPTAQPLEPWQRGGPVPQAPPPTVAMNAAGAVVPVGIGQTQPTQAMTPPGSVYGTPRTEFPRGREGGSAIPYGAGNEKPKPLGQRFNETLIYPIFSGVVIKDLAPFYRQFATLINAGLPLYQALGAMEGNTKNAKLKEVCRKAQAQVQAGGRLSDVLAESPWIFSKMQVEMIRAAEQGGMLDQVLRQVADYIEHELDIRRLVSRETFYPKLVLFFALMILGRPGFFFGQMAFVSLVLGSMGKAEYTGMNYLMDTLGFGFLSIFPIFAVVAVFRLFLFNVPGVHEGYDRFKLNIPVLGGLIKMFAIARFSRTFAALYRAGFTMPAALALAGDASGNAVVGRMARQAITAAERGQMVSETMAGSGFFPPLLVGMLRTGETTGSLDAMLDKVADFYESEGKMKSHQAALTFGVLCFLLVAILIGAQIISFYGGYGSQFSKEME